jgi:hypothetical protein
MQAARPERNLLVDVNVGILVPRRSICFAADCGCFFNGHPEDPGERSCEIVSIVNGE